MCQATKLFPRAIPFWPNSIHSRGLGLGASSSQSSLGSLLVLWLAKTLNIIWTAWDLQSSQSPHPLCQAFSLSLSPTSYLYLLKGTALSLRSNPVSSPSKESFFWALRSLLRKLVLLGRSWTPNLNLFTGLFTACLTCNCCTAEHGLVPPRQEGGSPT